MLLHDTQTVLDSLVTKLLRVTNKKVSNNFYARSDSVKELTQDTCDWRATNRTSIRGCLMWILLVLRRWIERTHRWDYSDCSLPRLTYRSAYGVAHHHRKKRTGTTFFVSFLKNICTWNHFILMLSFAPTKQSAGRWILLLFGYLSLFSHINVYFNQTAISRKDYLNKSFLAEFVGDSSAKEISGVCVERKSV